MGDHSPATALYNLRWDAQQSALLGSVATLLKEEAFVDTTVVADGQIFKAHRLLLSASSPFLKTVLQSVSCEHSVLMFPHINASDLKNVLRFIYEGEIKIKQGELKSFLQTAKLLKIKGMDFDMGEDTECESTSTTRTKEERNIKEVSISVKENHIQHTFDDSYYGDMSRVESSLPDGTTVSEDGNGADVDEENSNLNQENFEDEKDYTEILLDDDNEMAEDDGQECVENDEDEEGFPLQPEVSFEETDDSIAMNSMSSGLEIKSYQSMRTSWNIPHSSSTNNNNIGTTNRNSKTRQGQGFQQVSSQQSSSPKQTGKDGILLRMMREPLKSSTAGSYAHQQAPYDPNLRKTKRYVQCRSCSKVLSSLSALKRHMEDVHCARIQGKCLICGRVYSSRNSLLTHVYSAHKKHHDYKAVARIIRESDFEKFSTP